MPSSAGGDEPRVRPAAERRIAAENLHERLSFVGGDFFAAVPSAGDAYLLKYILHDWEDVHWRYVTRAWLPATFHWSPGRPAITPPASAHLRSS
jgi:hypothetical protein